MNSENQRVINNQTKFFNHLAVAIALMAFLTIPMGMWGQSDYSSVETSNVTLTAGTNGSACTVNSYGGIKVGTSSKGGDMTVTVPAGTTHLHVHAAAWNGVNGLSLNITPQANVSPTSIALTADNNISGNSPFTTSSAASYHYFVIALSNITTSTTIKFETSTTKRFVIWGCNAEEYSGGTPTPTSNVALASVDNVDLTATYSGGSLAEGNDADIAQGASVTLAYSNLAAGNTLAWVITKQSDNTDVTADVLSGNTLTVPTYDINISATLTPAQQYTITFYAGSGTCSTASQTYYEGTVITEFPTATPSTDCTAAGYTFDGWSATSVADGSSSYTKLASYTVSGTATLYAVYKLTEEGAFDNITSGDYKIYAIVGSTNYYATGSVASSAISSTTSLDNASSYTFEKSTDYGDGEWAIKIGSNYIKYSGNSTNLATQSTAYKWTISPGTKGTWRVTSETSGRALIFRAGTSNQFRGYSTGNVNGTEYFDLEIIGPTTTYATSPVCNPKVATPELSIGTDYYVDTQSVTITCATTGAEIHYTLDGSAPTSTSTLYNGAISISETKTLRAIAVLSGYDDSDIATATYTILTPLTTMQDIFDANTTSTAKKVAITFGNWVITGNNGGTPNKAWLTDNNGKGCSLYQSNIGFTANNVLTGTVICDLTRFGSSAQISGITSSSTDINGNGIVASEPGNVTVVEDVAISSLTGVNTGSVVQINNLTCTSANTSTKTYVLTDGNSKSITAKNTVYSALVLEEGKVYNLTGIYELSYSTNTIYPRSLSDVHEVVATTPTIYANPTSLSGFNYGEGSGPSATQTITVSGSNLEGDLTIALNNGTNFEISLYSGSGYTNSLTLSPTGGTVEATTVYVRMKAGLSIANDYADQINLTSTNATQVNVNLAGTVTEPHVTWDLTKASYSSASTTLVTWSSAYVTMTNAKGNSGTNANNGLGGAYSQTRFYQNQVITFTPTIGYAISSIEITATSSSYANTFANGTWDNGSATANNSTVTVNPTNGNNPVSVTLGSGAWASSVTVYYEASTLTPHSITNDVDMEHGTVVANPATAVVGATVTLKIYPAAGYYLDDDGDIAAYGSSQLALTKENAGTFTFTMPDEDVTVYAIFSAYSGTYYTLVNNTANLIPGRHYIIANSKEAGDAYVMAAYGSSYREAVATTVVGNIIYQTTNVHEIVLSGDNTNFWTLYDDGTGNASKGYLYAVSGNGLKNRTDYTSDNDGKWAISINDEGVATIVSQISGENVSNTIKFNNSTSPKRFSCYTPTSGQQSVYLYMKAGETDYELYSNTTVTSLNIGALDIYTVHSPAVLEITGAISNEGNHENLIIEDGGQLITNSAVSATLKKNITAHSSATGLGNTDGWYTIASPVANANYSIVTNGNYDLFLYDEETMMWLNQKPQATTGKFGQGIGYLYANDANQTLEFAGTMAASNSTVTVPLTCESTANLQGVNLVGNPFTCNVSNNVKIGGASLTTYYYVANGTELATAELSERAIKPAEGFLVQASAACNLVFNSTSKDRDNTKPAYVRIEAGNDNFMDRAYVQIGQGNTLRKMTLNDNVAHISVQHDGKDFAAATIEEAQGEMPVNFKASVDGSYTISVATEGIEANYLHLIDNLTGMDIDLLQTPSYTFNARKNDYASRFRLVFSANNANENNSDSFAFISNGQIILTNVDNDATIQVIDALGRMIANTNANNHVYTDNMAPGVYVLRLVNGNDVKTQKIVVK